MNPSTNAFVLVHQTQSKRESPTSNLSDTTAPVRESELNTFIYKTSCTRTILDYMIPVHTYVPGTFLVFLWHEDAATVLLLYWMYDRSGL